jgi:hypothetical protein
MLTLKLLAILVGVIYLIVSRSIRSLPRSAKRDGFFTTH